MEDGGHFGKLGAGNHSDGLEQTIGRWKEGWPRYLRKNPRMGHIPYMIAEGDLAVTARLLRLVLPHASIGE